MMRIFYSAGIFLFQLIINIASLFNVKARLWVGGRKNIFESLEKKIDKTSPLIWFHCASLGEFEQGRPVIEALRQSKPEYKILLTFFSPSGYEVRKNYAGVDYVFYLPMDTVSNARRFIELVQPQMVFFVKYEFWYNYINLLHKKGIALISFSTIFRPSQHFFKPWGGWFRKQLRKFSWFFVQNQTSLELLQGIGIQSIDISGDTRFDRVVDLVHNHSRDRVLENFKGESDLIIFGSSWAPDEQIALDLLARSKTDFKLVIAPHLIDAGRIKQLKRLFKDYSPALYSEQKRDAIIDTQVLIVDSMGHLSSMYYYAKLAYIGGGFGVGIHNLLEAAAFGKPVIFGPNHQRFKEALDLAAYGGGFPIGNSQEYYEVVHKLLDDPKYYKVVGETAGNYVLTNAGATKMVIDKASQYLD